MKRAGLIDKTLEATYGEVRPFLDYSSPFQLLIGVILSAQSTDAQVNKILPGLFSRWPAPCDWANAPLEEIETAVFSTGFYRNKAKNIRKTSELICSKNGEILLSFEELLSFPGVGRKSANVLRGAVGGLPAFIVDTHFSRVCTRLGLTQEKSPDAIEFSILPLIASERSYGFSMRINLLGRRVCHAKKPECAICPVALHCPSSLKEG